MRETDLLLKAVRQLLSLILKYKLVELKTPQQCGIRVCVCVCLHVCVLTASASAQPAVHPWDPGLLQRVLSEFSLCS